jgi:3-deoxy-D-manno-octulosonic-acid transferase
VRRFLRHHRPALGVLMETEIWPNLLHGRAAAGVPMVLANARLSEKQPGQGPAPGPLLHPALAR